MRNEINNFKTDTVCICPGFLNISLYWKIKKSQNCYKERGKLFSCLCTYLLKVKMAAKLKIISKPRNAKATLTSTTSILKLNQNKKNTASFLINPFKTQHWYE